MLATMQVRPLLQQVERRTEEVRSAGARWPDVDRLVIAQTGRLGDFVLTLPVVGALRQAYPEAEFGLVVAPGVAALARLVPGVRRVLVCEPGGADLVVELRVFAPRLMVCVARSAALAWAAWRAGVPHRVGSGRRAYSWLFNRRVVEPRQDCRRHELEYSLSFAHRAGAPGGPVRFPLAVPDDDARAARAWLERHGIGDRFVVLHPGSGGSCPRWPPVYFAKLAALLEHQGVRVVFSAGPQDPEIVRGLRHREGAPPLFVDDLPLLAALLDAAALVVSNSTGPVHLATALDTPALAIQAPWATCGAGRWGPYGEHGWAIVADNEAARSWSHAERHRHAAELMAGITPESVLGCVQHLLAGRTPTL